MESGIPHPQRPLRTDSHVLRTNQLPHYLSDDDEYDLSARDRPRMAFRIHGRPSHPYKTKTGRNRRTTSRETSKAGSPRPRHPRETRPLSQTREMLFRTRRDRLPRSHSRKRQIRDEPAKAEWH